MLDLKFIRDNPDAVRAMLAARRMTAPLEELIEADRKWRELLGEAESLRSHQNTVSKGIAQLKRDNQDASEQIAEMRTVSQKIKTLNEQSQSYKSESDKILGLIPNMPHISTPIGNSEADNVEISRWGEIRNFDFEPKPHWELAEALDIVDFQRGAKVAGSNFVLYKGLGAKLERALINFMLDLHVAQHGYTEVSPPFVANRPTMTGTGQLPKFESDMYRCDRDEDNEEMDLFLIPTAEVPVTNIFAGEILNGEDLPIYYTAYTPCFRREAGSYGRETRGLQRLHQFDKVEMVKFTFPETSYDEHESLLRNGEAVCKPSICPIALSRFVQRISGLVRQNVTILNYGHRSTKSLTWKFLRAVILRIFRRAGRISVSVVNRARSLNWCIPLTHPEQHCRDWSSQSLKRISRRMEVFGFQRLSCLIWVGLR